jgi:hypothetical protein
MRCVCPKVGEEVHSPNHILTHTEGILGCSGEYSEDTHKDGDQAT